MIAESQQTPNAPASEYQRLSLIGGHNEHPGAPPH